MEEDKKKEILVIGTDTPTGTAFGTEETAKTLKEAYEEEMLQQMKKEEPLSIYQFTNRMLEKNYDFYEGDDNSSSPRNSKASRKKQQKSRKKSKKARKARKNNRKRK